MNRSKLNFYKRLILKRQREILAYIDDWEENIDELQDARSTDELDRATDTGALELMMALGDSERRELREIDRALEKIANGTYGICENCGGEIASSRLEAIPTARLCRPCKEAEERDQPAVSLPRRRMRWVEGIDEEELNEVDEIERN